MPTAIHEDEDEDEHIAFQLGVTAISKILKHKCQVRLLPYLTYLRKFIHSLSVFRLAIGSSFQGNA